MIPVIQSLKLRDRVLEKTGGRCAYCGKQLFVTRRGHMGHIGEEPLSVDHIIPRHLGGGDEIDNLLPSCKRCNSTKDKYGVEEFRRRVWAQRLNAKTGQSFNADQWEWIRENASNAKVGYPQEQVFYHEQL